jgi:hypothetical protein
VLTGYFAGLPDFDMARTHSSTRSQPAALLLLACGCLFAADFHSFASEQTAVIPMQSSPPDIIAPSDPAQAAIENLRANGPHSGHADTLRTFGQFIGVWDMDVKLFDRVGKLTYHQPCVWMFSWILDGRAIQDVLVGPPRPGSHERGIGTTIRYFNEATGRWQITWMSAASSTYIHLEGGRQNDEIVMEGADVDGSPLRWMFTEITPESFHWRGYISDDSGKSWRMEQEMLAHRRVMPAMTPSEGHALWNRTDRSGFESARLLKSCDGWQISGAASFQYDNSPCLLAYAVRCDAAWRSRSASVHGIVAGKVVDHELCVTPAGRWIHNGIEIPELDGCIDLDLNFSPSTNTLPIRRLGLPVGGTEKIRAAWLRFPSFELEALPQSYTRESTGRYEYRSREFVAELSVDSAGLVRDYPPTWQSAALTQDR